MSLRSPSPPPLPLDLPKEEGREGQRGGERGTERGERGRGEGGWRGGPDGWGRVKWAGVTEGLLSRVGGAQAAVAARGQGAVRQVKEGQVSMNTT